MRLTHLCVGGTIIVAACSTAPKPTPAASAAAVTDSSRATRPPSDVLLRTRITAGESFSPQQGEAALRAFVPEVAFVDSGGECYTGRVPGSSVTTITASFPSRKDRRTNITLTFDSAGHLVRYNEQRGVPPVQSTAGLTDAQRDSVLRAASAATRTTSLSFDYAVDQAIVMNRGGGKPTNAIIGTIRSMERLEKLGPPTARIERARKLCGV